MTKQDINIRYFHFYMSLRSCNGLSKENKNFGETFCEIVQRKNSLDCDQISKLVKNVLD